MGGGVVGSTVAWLLSCRGHRVALYDPGTAARTASLAALGVLMGHCSQTGSGRGWRLRKRSIAAYRQWLPLLQAEGHHLPHRWGLTLAVHDQGLAERLQQLVVLRRKQAITLTWQAGAVARRSCPWLAWDDGLLGLLHSPHDGQVDPGSLIEALGRSALARGLVRWREQVTSLAARPAGGWRLQGANGSQQDCEAVLLCNGLGGPALLQRSGLDLNPALQLEPVLGQAAELRLRSPAPLEHAWMWRGVNLIPRAPGHLWIGATLEPGEQASGSAFEQLLGLGGAAPPWLQGAELMRRWQGLRPRPIGRPAPVLEQVATGLWLALGHYRNGTLLAPATALWLAEALERG